MKKPTVTFASSALNEEKNILPFLNSVLSQTEKEFILKKILIISDGSTDNTVKLIKSLKSKKIQVLDSKKRIGKSSRLNQIYKLLDSNFLVQADADILLADPLVIYEMVKPLIKDPLIGMCGGQVVPLPGLTFTEKADEITFKIYMRYLRSIRNGNCVFCSDGRILSYKKELVKKIIVPKDMIANDFYTYFFGMHAGYKCKYVKKAVVNFRASQNIKDKIKQNLRSAAIPLRMLRYFPKELIHKQMRVPFLVRLDCIVSQFFTNPIYCLYIYSINKYCEIKANSVERHLNAKWAIALTTKKLI